ncbi:MAG: hypothetical protein IJY15_07735, partial [Thermoguttaceae bacterium]|nr:hypothetical protein [Thermoguttaceae bacterium]
MSAKKRKGGGSAKIRVDFKRNRNDRTRVVDWTRRYNENRAAAETFGNDSDDYAGLSDSADFSGSANAVDDASSGERVVGKSETTRRRTVVGTFVGAENPSGEVGDFAVLPDVDLSVCRKG